jgi:hypothetical protein
MSRSGIIQVVLFFVYLLVQVLLLRNLVLFNTAFCFFVHRIYSSAPHRN